MVSIVSGGERGSGPQILRPDTVRSDTAQHAAPRARGASVSLRDLQAHIIALLQHLLACMYSYERGFLM